MMRRSISHISVPLALKRIVFPAVLVLTTGCILSDDDDVIGEIAWNVDGIVRDAGTHQPLSGVEVSFGWFYAGSTSYSDAFLTDSTGAYHRVNWGCRPSDQYRIRFAKGGYRTLELQLASELVRVGDCRYRLDVELEVRVPLVGSRSVSAGGY